MKHEAFSRPAGVLYLVIIVLGLTSEIAVRTPLAGLGGGDLVNAVTAGETLFRLSILADAAMVACDIALAYLLFRLLSPVNATLAGVAALFRLAQAAVIGANLTVQYDALLWVGAGQGDMARHALELHAAGYDIGLIFFGINSLLTGVLLVWTAEFSRPLGWMLGTAGIVYLTGSSLRILNPTAAEAFMPAYLIAIVAEVSFAVALLRMRRLARTHGIPAL